MESANVLHPSWTAAVTELFTLPLPSDPSLLTFDAQLIASFLPALHYPSSLSILFSFHDYLPPLPAAASPLAHARNRRVADLERYRHF